METDQSEDTDQSSSEKATHIPRFTGFTAKSTHTAERKTPSMFIPDLRYFIAILHSYIFGHLS